MIPSPFRYHSLATRTYSLSTAGSAFLRLDDDRAVHAVGDVGQHRLGAAVVHEDAGIVGLEAEGEGLARRDVLERLVRRDAGGVEVDRVRDRAAVRERHLDGLTLANVHDRAGGAVAVERPRVVLDTGGDLDRHVLEGHVHLDEVAGGERRQRRVVRACARRRARPRSRARRRRSCSAAARRCGRSHGPERRRAELRRRASSRASAHISSAKKPSTATRMPSSSAATLANAADSVSTGGRWSLDVGREAMAGISFDLVGVSRKVGRRRAFSPLARPQTSYGFPATDGVSQACCASRR